MDKVLITDHIGAFIVGEKFRTLLTGRAGHIVPTPKNAEVGFGVWVWFDDSLGEWPTLPTTKVLHPEVVVEVIG